jgi:hypothetical protein
MEYLEICAITMHLGSLRQTGPACRSDLDSHADASVVGMEVITFQDFERPVNVSGYDPKGPMAMALKTVSAGMAYDVPGNGRVVILIVHQEINLPHLPHNLLNPMQMRLNDVVVNETPKFQCANPTNISHTITVKGENMNDELIIPLDLRGVVSCFTIRKPTQEEFYTCDQYELTYESPVYEPSGSSYVEQEAAMMDSRGQLKVAEDKHPLRHQICPVHITAGSIIDTR